MPIAAAPVVAQTFLYAMLHVDSVITGYVGTRIYADYTPTDSPLPAIVIKQMDPGQDLTAMGSGAERIKSEPLYIVEVVGQTRSYIDLGPIADRIDILLQGKSGPAQDGYVYDCRREQPYQLAELIGSVDYRHLGGYYRLFVGPG